MIVVRDFSDNLGMANFNLCDFNGMANFNLCDFIGMADFSAVEFNDTAEFVWVKFNGMAEFVWVKFNGMANFNGGEFNDTAEFVWVKFNGMANFVGVKFNGVANFYRGEFNDAASFDSAEFNDVASFEWAEFNNTAEFLEVKFNGEADFRWAEFNDTAEFLEVEFNDKALFSGATFYKINLTDAYFEEDIEANWDSFEDTIDCNGITYIKFIKNFRNNEQFGDANRAYYKYRKENQADKSISFSKLSDSFMCISCGYGVRPENTLVLGSIVVLFFTFIYWKGNGIKRLKGSNEDDNIDVSFWDGFYFSMVTFTTVGYGDWYPTDKYRKFVMLEGFLGWLLLALFLVTLTNIMIMI